MPHFGEPQPKCLLGMYRISQTQNTIRYYPFGADYVTPVEVSAQDGMPRGTFKKLKITVESNTLTVNATICIRINGADTALTITVVAGAVGIYTIRASVPVAENDLCCFCGRVPIGAGTIIFHPIAVFEAA